MSLARGEPCPGGALPLVPLDASSWVAIIRYGLCVYLFLHLQCISGRSNTPSKEEIEVKGTVLVYMTATFFCMADKNACQKTHILIFK